MCSIAVIKLRDSVTNDPTLFMVKENLVSQKGKRCDNAWTSPPWCCHHFMGLPNACPVVSNKARRSRHSSLCGCVFRERQGGCGKTGLLLRPPSPPLDATCPECVWSGRGGRVKTCQCLRRCSSYCHRQPL